LLCIAFIDQPIALDASHLLSNKIQNNSAVQDLPTLLTELVYLFITIGLGIYFFAKTSHKNFYFLNTFGLMANTMAIAFFIKSTLQFFFGRYAPRYAHSDILLFTRNAKLYGFHWLQNGGFPSGHMCVFGAGLVIIAYAYPKFKIPALILGTGLGLVLILLNYHFLSDVIAGAYLGISIGFSALLLNKNIKL